MTKNTKLFFDLLVGMTSKELQARYKHTVFGFLWMIINPIIQMLVIGFVFKFLIKSPIENYFPYLFIGLLVWNFFSLSLNKATSCIIWERNLIKKARFPIEVIPLSIILSNLVHLTIATFIFATLFLFTTTFTLKIIFLCAGFVLLTAFTIGFCLLTSALNVKFRDVSFFVSALLVVWFYATPIVYTLSMIPPQYYWLWQINPLTTIFSFFQYSFLQNPLPESKIIITNCLLIVFFLACGIALFKKESKNFDDWL